MKYILSLLLVLISVPAFAEQNIVIVFDDSGSMNEYLRTNRQTTRMEAAKSALSKAIADLPADTNLGLVTLNGRWTPQEWQIPLGPLDKEKALAAVAQIRPTGSTRLGSTLKVGADELLKFREKRRYGIYKLVVVTDGLADPGTEANTLEKFVPDVLSRGVTIDAIGVDMDQTHTLATKVNSYQNGNNPEALATAIAATLAETSVKDASFLEDFQIIASIPDEMAVKLLEAVQSSDNHPIGEAKPVVHVDKETGVVTVSPATPPKTNWLMWILFPLAAVLGLFLSVILFSKRS